MLFTNQIQDYPCKHLLPASQTTRHLTFNLVSRVNTVKCWPHWLEVCKESNHSLHFFHGKSIPWKKMKKISRSTRKQRRESLGSRFVDYAITAESCFVNGQVLYWTHLILAQNYPQLKEQDTHGCSLI